MRNRRPKKLKKLRTLLAAALLALTVVAAPTASAAQKNLVAFGDSILADPGADIYLSSRLTSSTANGANCPSSNNFAKRTGAKVGLPVRDYSCSGAVSMSQGPQISTQIDTAIRNGALTADTQRVIFSSGFNDTYNNSNLSRDQLRARFVRTTAPQIERIKRAAPNARIQIVGYPTIGSGNRYCLLHFGPNLSDSTYLPQVRGWEDSAQWMQVDLARATGTEFVDIKPQTRNNGMCAGAGDRYFAGLIDFTGGNGNLPIHINARGHEAVARILARS
ncbi:GDSL-type esterase/lipase family protein [Corynebacterium casei]|uniref:GDSL-type esterase/lipase family protein n=1 Tax=Corynebacterium casei TaxID=160386 RepID=UPI00264A41CB|nr:GDSL-type esterase/lipase family protein [Corynebacterium casei]MDN6263723.1 GDSL-type esterase/lipase family protein [Corynebacterium casei]